MCIRDSRISGQRSQQTASRTGGDGPAHASSPTLRCAPSRSLEPLSTSSPLQQPLAVPAAGLLVTAPSSIPFAVAPWNKMRALCPSPHLARGGDSARPDLLRKVHSASRSRSPALCRIVASTRLLAAVTLHAPLGTASLALEHSRQGDTGRHFAAIRSHASQSCRVRRIAPRRAAISARRQPRSVRPQLHNPPRISSCRHPRTRARARSRVGTTLRALFFTLSLVFLRRRLTAGPAASAIACEGH